MQSAHSVIIETDRLRLDALRAADAAALFACRGDPEVARYQGWQPRSEAEAAAFIAKQAGRAFGAAGGWSQCAIRLRESGELIGDLGVQVPADRDAAIAFGVSLQPARQRRGYAREAVAALFDHAFGIWGRRRVVASVDPRNTASRALCRALGMRLEAHHVESLCADGVWVDDLIFALLAREWRAAADVRRGR